MASASLWIDPALCNLHCVCAAPMYREYSDFGREETSMIEFRRNHAVSYAVIVVALGMAISLLAYRLVEMGINAGMPSVLAAAGAILVKSVPIIVAVAFLAATGRIGLIRLRGTGFGRGLACGAVLIVLFCVMGLYAIANVATGEAAVNVPVIIKALFYFLLVGVGEEFLTRAVAGETLLEHFGLTHAGTVKACVVSGVIFGAMHVVNISSIADVPSVAMQMLFTAGMGMLFGAVYFRCGNIWATVILHMLWDASLFSVTTSSDFAKTASSSTSVGNGNPIGSVIIIAAFVGISLFLLRKSKTAQVREAWAGVIAAPVDGE